jgi:hypothetical protein
MKINSRIQRMGEEEPSAKALGLKSADPTPNNSETTTAQTAEVDSQSHTDTCEQLWWLTGGLAKWIEGLPGVLERVEALGQSTSEGLERLKDFEAHVERLASTAEPVKAFCGKLEELALELEPVGTVHEEMVRMMGEFGTHLLQLANLVQPAVVLRLRAAELAKTLEPVDELVAQFARLAGVFQLASQREGALLRDAGH